jgi:hypothetical protein
MSSLGKLLAIALDGPAPPASSDPSLVEVQKKLAALKSAAAAVPAVPDRACLVDKPFLEGNADFFLAYLGATRGMPRGFHECGSLTRHLNDCHRCFDIYCQTLRDYHNHKEIQSR